MICDICGRELVGKICHLDDLNVCSYCYEAEQEFGKELSHDGT